MSRCLWPLIKATKRLTTNSPVLSPPCTKTALCPSCPKSGTARTTPKLTNPIIRPPKAADKAASAVQQDTVVGEKLVHNPKFIGALFLGCFAAFYFIDLTETAFGRLLAPVIGEPKESGAYGRFVVSFNAGLSFLPESGVNRVLEISGAGYRRLAGTDHFVYGLLLSF